MDKETLSNYGWIVICVLILAVMLALATPFGTFIADGFKATYAGFEMVGSNAMDIVNVATGNDSTDLEAPQNGESTPGAVFTENPDGTVDGVVPPTGVVNTPPEIPADGLPANIDFSVGKFESVTTYIPGEYKDVEFETSITSTKFPVYHQEFVWSKWQISKDNNENIINIVPFEISLSDIDTKYSTYIAYDFNTDEHLIYNGVVGDSVQLYTIYNENGDTLDNIIYLAAYYQKATGADLHIAQWNGTCYEAADCDAEVDAVDTFTQTIKSTETRKVLVTAPSYNTTYSYVPVGTLKAEAGMTWAEWLASDYNTTGETAPTIKTADFEDVSYDDIITADKDYGFVVYDAPQTITCTITDLQGTYDDYLLTVPVGTTWETVIAQYSDSALFYNAFGYVFYQYGDSSANIWDTDFNTIPISDVITDSIYYYESYVVE